jgi:hypothetical protein
VLLSLFTGWPNDIYDFRCMTGLTVLPCNLWVQYQSCSGPNTGASFIKRSGTSDLQTVRDSILSYCQTDTPSVRS